MGSPIFRERPSENQAVRLKRVSIKHSKNRRFEVPRVPYKRQQDLMIGIRFERMRRG